MVLRSYGWYFVLALQILTVGCVKFGQNETSEVVWSGPKVTINGQYGIYQNQLGDTGLALLDDPSPAFVPIDADDFGAPAKPSAVLRGASSADTGVISHSSPAAAPAAWEINSDENSSSATREALEKGASLSVALSLTAASAYDASPKPGSKEYCAAACARRVTKGIPCDVEKECTFAKCKARWCSAVPGLSCGSACTGYDCKSLPSAWAKDESAILATALRACNARRGGTVCETDYTRGMYLLCDQLICKVKRCEGRRATIEDSGLSLCGNSFWPGYSMSFSGTVGAGNYEDLRDTVKYPYHSCRLSSCATGFERQFPGECAPCCESLEACPEKYNACINQAQCKDTTETCEP